MSANVPPLWFCTLSKRTASLAIGLPLASSACTETVVALPGRMEDGDSDNVRLLAFAAMKSTETVAESAVSGCRTVTVARPTIVDDVSRTVPTPLELVLAELAESVPAVVEKVTASPATLFPSASCTKALKMAVDSPSANICPCALDKIRDATGPTVPLPPPPPPSSPPSSNPPLPSDEKPPPPPQAASADTSNRANAPRIPRTRIESPLATSVAAFLRVAAILIQKRQSQQAIPTLRQSAFETSDEIEPVADERRPSNVVKMKKARKTGLFHCCLVGCQGLEPRTY